MMESHLLKLKMRSISKSCVIKGSAIVKWKYYSWYGCIVVLLEQKVYIVLSNMYYYIYCFSDVKGARLYPIIDKVHLKLQLAPAILVEQVIQPLAAFNIDVNVVFIDLEDLLMLRCIWSKIYKPCCNIPFVSSFDVCGALHLQAVKGIVRRGDGIGRDRTRTNTNYFIYR